MYTVFVSLGSKTLKQKWYIFLDNFVKILILTIIFLTAKNHTIILTKE